MKKILITITFLSVIHTSKAQSNPTIASSLKTFKELYTIYMTAIESLTPKNFAENERRDKSLKREYCTKKHSFWRKS
jgi:hypothetical protein